MSAYADTGLLCSVYSPDAHSAAAIQRLTRTRSAVPLIWLHHLELRNALRLRVFRGEITPVQRDAVLNAFLTDIASGVFVFAETAIEELGFGLGVRASGAFPLR